MSLTRRVKRWDAYTTTVTITNSGDWTPVNITGATLFFIVRNTQSPVTDDDEDALITKTVT